MYEKFSTALACADRLAHRKSRSVVVWQGSCRVDLNQRDAEDPLGEEVDSMRPGLRKTSGKERCPASLFRSEEKRHDYPPRGLGQRFHDPGRLRWIAT